MSRFLFSFTRCTEVNSRCVSSCDGDTSSSGLEDGPEEEPAAFGVGPELELLGEVSVVALWPCVRRGDPVSEDWEFGDSSMIISST